MNIDIAWLQSQFPDLSELYPLSGGGFKAVFSAKHADEGDVVLKLIKPSQDLEDVSREILAVSKIQAPRVPRILAHGQISTVMGDCYWLREERVIGYTVRECLQAGAFGKADLLHMGVQLLEALAKAEEARIVHRDVKPDNIMRDNNGEFWLLDFGIARHLQLESRTATALRFGKFTPGYAPPEQFRNIKPAIDSRSDLFALGVTLYECSTGINPFRQGTADELQVLKRVEQMPLPLLSLPSFGDNELADLVSSMTQKRPDQRPPTVVYALEWMRQICVNEQV